jgi:hypothetical protein
VPAGDRVYASDGQRIVSRGRRVTNSAAITTTETGLLRVDNIPVFDAKCYRILTSNLNVDAATANDVADVKLRAVQAVTPGTSASTSSTQIGSVRNVMDDIAFSNKNPLSAYWFPSADGYLSVLLSLVRSAGAGNLVAICSSTEPWDLVIEELGTDPGDTGVVI